MGRAKVTPKIIDHIHSLKAAELTYGEINVVLERDYDIVLSMGQISNIVNGIKHSDKGSFTDQDKEYINSLLDGEEAVVKPDEIDRLTKFSIVENVVREGKESTIEHFNKTAGTHLDDEKIVIIEEEVMTWIDKNDLRDDNEIWFKNRIFELKKGN